VVQVKALVTGSAGFVGRHMLRGLRDRGWFTVGVDPHGPSGGVDALDVFAARRQSHDVRYDLVVHCAAQAPHRAAIDGQPATHVYNQLLDAAMFDWAIRTGQGRVLYFSSCAALDPNLDDYGWTKLTGERMATSARRAGVPVTVVRPFSGYGEDQGKDWPFRTFVERAKQHEDPFTIWGDGQQVRDWIHIDDVVAGALAVAESGTEDPVDLCTGIGTSMTALALMVCREVGYEPEFEYRLDMHGGSPYRVGSPFELSRYYRPQVSLEEGVKRALAG
jgi:nucleoside-diphosphate-sugar epimerase